MYWKRFCSRKAASVDFNDPAQSKTILIGTFLKGQQLMATSIKLNASNFILKKQVLTLIELIPSESSAINNWILWSSMFILRWNIMF